MEIEEEIISLMKQPEFLSQLPILELTQNIDSEFNTSREAINKYKEWIRVFTDMETRVKVHQEEDPQNTELFTQQRKCIDLLVQYCEKKIKEENNFILFISSTYTTATVATFTIQKAWRHYKLYNQRARQRKIKRIQQWWREHYWRPGGKKFKKIKRHFESLIRK